MPSSTTEGGIKGFFTRAGTSFIAGGLYAKEKAWTLAKMGGKVGFYVATTSIVVLMPLIFEIMREGQVRGSQSLLSVTLLWKLTTDDK